MTAVTISSDFGAQENNICQFPLFSPFICHDVMVLDGMILVVFNVEFQVSFFTLLFHPHQEVLQSLNKRLLVLQLTKDHNLISYKSNLQQADVGCCVIYRKVNFLGMFLQVMGQCSIFIYGFTIPCLYNQFLSSLVSFLYRIKFFPIKNEKSVKGCKCWYLKLKSSFLMCVPMCVYLGVAVCIYNKSW